MYAIALLPALLLAAPTVEGVRAGLTDGRLDVEVTASETLYRDDVRAKLDGKALSLYIDGAEVRVRKTFANGPLTVTAWPRSTYTKLELPLGADLGCAGAVTLKIEDSVLKASVRCTGAAARTAPAETAPVAAVAAAPVARPEPAPPRAEVKPEAKLAAKPAAAVEKPAATVEKPAPAAVETPAAAAVEKPAPAERPSLTGKPSASEVAAAARAVPKDNSPSPFTLVVFVALAAVAGYLLWRKRKQQHTGLIKILETASIGAKRSIVIAEVNGQRMILGTSEAGISVLSGQGHFTSTGIHPALALAAAEAAPTPTLPVAAAPDEQVNDGESNMLARLFQRRKKDEPADDEESGPSTMAEDFRDLLEDSLEDEELRRRLATGSSGRTS
jgi:flagellar biogenesis protein FliO